MKVLVTGATGFIGSHIVDHLLAQGDSVRALVRPARAERTPLLERERLVWSYGDLVDPTSLQSATDGIEVVYHAAALLTAHSDELMRLVNVTGVKNLLEACVQNRVERLVFVSSVAAYAPMRDLVVSEQAPLGGWGPYGRSKAEAEALIRSYADSFRLAYSIVRPCVVYGEGDHNNFTPRLLRLLRRAVIPVLNGDDPHMITVHAADIAQAIILAGTHPKALGQAYNVTGGAPTSLRELAGIYAELTGERKRLLPIPRLGVRTALLARWLLANLRHRRWEQVAERFRAREYQRSFFLRSHQYDISKARGELGYEPGINLREGLRRTLAWANSGERHTLSKPIDKEAR
jgi:nucleoside-diphosphate-sugar epimerase